MRLRLILAEVKPLIAGHGISCYHTKTIEESQGLISLKDFYIAYHYPRKEGEDIKGSDKNLAYPIRTYFFMPSPHFGHIVSKAGISCPFGQKLGLSVCESIPLKSFSPSFIPYFLGGCQSDFFPGYREGWDIGV